MKPSNLKNLSAAELLVIYNTHAKKSVARFSDRKSALRRTEALLAELNASGKPKVDAPTPAAEAMADRKSRAAVLVSEDPKAARADWKEYSSTMQAFEALKLPMGVHKKFRRKLKLAGKAQIDKFTFEATYHETKKK